jgi:FAD/FMN-containing dehydrogenase
MARFSDELVAILGKENFFEQGAIDNRYRQGMSRKYVGEPAYVARPGNTAEVSAILRAANDARIPVTALGGGTGVVGGGTALPGGLVLSLERMRQIEEIDSSSLTMTVQAGVTIQAAQEAAEAKQMFFPLDLGARGTATIGGTIGTNAGGNRVIRWGMMRDMVLGLEAVLADGSVVAALGKAIKDNAGYNWKHLLIGSEGTLGIVTRAVLRLRPQPLTTATAVLAMDSFENVVSVLRYLEGALSGTLSSYEVMWDNFYELVTRANAAKRERPLPLGHRHYVLVESLGSDPVADPVRFEAVLGEVLAKGWAADAVIAQSPRDSERLWAVREDLMEPFSALYPMFAFDVSMPTASMPTFVERASAGIRAAFPDAINLFYGHLGDGNLHLVTKAGRGDAAAEHIVDTVVYDLVGELGGSISAEHGIGLAKREFLGRTRSPTEIQMMRRIKFALDPNGILNPDKIFQPDHA